MQSGKSLMVNAVLLSLIREDPSFGVGKANEVSVFLLSVDSLPKVWIHWSGSRLDFTSICTLDLL